MSNRVLALGDIHGDWRPIRDLNKRTFWQFDETDTIILLGDAGLNYYFDSRDKRVKEKLGKIGCTFFIIRGNHEERPSNCAAAAPNEWHTETYFKNTVYVENEFPYIKYALDIPSVYEIYGYRTLVIPGAYSVDKMYRIKMGWSWFPEEQLSESEMKEGLRLIDFYDNYFDIVLSHTSPIIYQPTDLFLSIVDQNTVDESMERYLGQIEYKIQYGLWLWGHFHKFRVYPPDGNKQCVMLYNDKALDVLDTMDNLEKIGYIGKTYEIYS